MKFDNIEIKENKIEYENLLFYTMDGSAGLNIDH